MSEISRGGPTTGGQHVVPQETSSRTSAFSPADGGIWRGLPAHSRLLKFSFVGVIGIAVQLAVLAGLTAMRVNYLVATALAVEAAVLHNFLWHQSFTWADRGASSAEAVKRLLRFHVSNGAISLIGNLLLMRIFVGWFGIPVIVSNIATIALCALANFAASDRWVFEPAAKCQCEG
jgi:putative flippase GtrA